MANQLALRELQSRLATRLEQAREGETVTGWLAVEIGSKGFLLPLTQSGEIFPTTAVQTVPYTQDWFWGVANLRGGLYGVVDMHQFLFGVASPARAETGRLQSRLVALNAALDLNCVLLIDRLAGLRQVQSFTHELKSEGERPGFFGATLVDENQRQWQELNLQKLAADSNFLAVGAVAASPTH